MRLLAAAEQLFAERGFHRTQVSHLTEAAGLSIGIFYRYFEDKEDILHQLLDGYFADFLEVVRTMRRSVNRAPPPEKLAIIKSLLRFAFSYNVGQRPGAFLCWHRHGHGVSTAIDKRIASFISDIESIVAADIRGSTLIRAPDPETLAQCFVGMALGLIQRMIDLGAPDIDTAVSECARIISTSLLSYAPKDVYDALHAAFADLMARA
jgi:AcrR family transcriptional regulator